VSESSAAARAKLALVPPQRLASFEQLIVAGTPEDVIQRVRTLLEVGFQYVMFFVPGADWESLELLARRVLPSLTGLTTPVASPALAATRHANV
jgi:alkanesulfonate monooxygenase SsuD/methylene tetrahydromethanopterin reductase-like flavin-dependent oxidoreductase (luciferase family)